MTTIGVIPLDCINVILHKFNYDINAVRAVFVCKGWRQLVLDKIPQISSAREYFKCITDDQLLILAANRVPNLIVKDCLIHACENGKIGSVKYLLWSLDKKICSLEYFGADICDCITTSEKYPDIRQLLIKFLRSHQQN